MARGLRAEAGRGEALARKGLNGAVASLLDPPNAKLVGPAPVDGDGLPIAPYDLWGHDALWRLDKMVRSNQPLVEPALVFPREPRLLRDGGDAPGQEEAALVSSGSTRILRRGGRWRRRQSAASAPFAQPLEAALGGPVGGPLDLGRARSIGPGEAS